MEIITITVTDGEEIKESHVFKQENYEKGDGLSQYFRIFDPSCISWTHEAERNRKFLEIHQQHANDILRTKGYVFLNEVYDMLGLPRTRIGQLVGWRLGSYIDFGLDNELNFDENGSYVNKPVLDFNVDGFILSSIC